jgi:hypothetical protein
MDAHQWSVLAIAFAIYVGDSALLLFPNEAILSRSSSKRWTAWIASEKYRFAARYLFIPNPLTPHQPLFRLTWELAAAPSSSDLGEWSLNVSKYRPLASGIFVAAIMLFIGTPTMLVAAGYEGALCALVLAYLGVTWALSWLYAKRHEFGLSMRTLAGLAFESLVCLPCSVNLIRKVSQRATVAEDTVSACRRLLRPHDWDAACRCLIVRVDNAIDGEEVGTPAWQSLVDRRDWLARQL